MPILPTTDGNVPQAFVSPNDLPIKTLFYTDLYHQDGSPKVPGFEPNKELAKIAASRTTPTPPEKTSVLQIDGTRRIYYSPRAYFPRAYPEDPTILFQIQTYNCKPSDKSNKPKKSHNYKEPADKFQPQMWSPKGGIEAPNQSQRLGSNLSLRWVMEYGA